MTKRKPTKITHQLWALLQSGAVSSIHHDFASVRKHGDRFVMNGISGEHTLLVIATDEKRLNAHWQIFATHAANQSA